MLKNKNLIFMQFATSADFKILLDKIHLYFSVPLLLILFQVCKFLLYF